MGFIRFVLGLVAFVIAIKLVAILLAIIGFALKLLWIAIVLGVLILVAWLIYKMISPRASAHLSLRSRAICCDFRKTHRTYPATVAIQLAPVITSAFA
jgi:hypothetical protein